MQKNITLLYILIFKKTHFVLPFPFTKTLTLCVTFFTYKNQCTLRYILYLNFYRIVLVPIFSHVQLDRSDRKINLIS